eukprot:gb/GECH01002749.1/.p1 GENE.gb/GECH01002749.1/~~gb/GECH01002749.1/.p1  ORF type:complete len:202 (+),score=70.48 gb/GECH01002749.1/:1-606(+)
MGCGNSKAHSNALNVRTSQQISKPEEDFTFKVLLMGDSSVGKTSIALRLTDDAFAESFVPTIGVDFKMYKLSIDSKTIKMHVWDTAGQEKFRNISSAYYRGAHGAVLIFDLTQLRTLENIRFWFEEVQKHSSGKENGGNGLQIILVGNKSDLGEQRDVQYEHAKEFAESLGIEYLEVSAKTGDQIPEAFAKLAEIMMKEKQ